MSGENKSEEQNPELVKKIQKNAEDVRQVKKKKIKVMKPSIDWVQIKENVDNLKTKYADISLKYKKADSEETKAELAQQANEIWKELYEIKAMIERRR